MDRKYSVFKPFKPVLVIWKKKKVYPEPCQTSKMELFMKIVDNQRPLTIFTKRCLTVL